MSIVRGSVSGQALPVLSTAHREREYRQPVMPAGGNNLEIKHKHMKENVLFGAIALLAGSLLAADSNPQDAVKDAAKSLGAKDNYSWKTTIDFGGDTVGTIEGKTEKGGATFLALSRGDQGMDAVLKGGKGVLKLEEGWKTVSEVAEDSGQQGAPRMVARILQDFKAPAEEAADLAGKTKELKLADGVYAGDLTADAIKDRLRFGRRSGGDAPNVSGAKGSVKFWLKDGSIAKYEFSVQGTVTFNGNDRDVDLKNAVVIKDVGTTKVTVPEEAAKKL
jgi:hypothetical protein